MAEWTEVYSSNIDSVSYDSENQEFLVRWKKSGKVSAYSGVPAEVAEQAANNWSVTEYINDVIKPNYEHRYV